MFKNIHTELQLISCQLSSINSKIAPNTSLVKQDQKTKETGSVKQDKGVTEKEQIRRIMFEQLKCLRQKSENCQPGELPGITRSMIDIANYLLLES